jgi:hypothetical protein
VIEIVEIVCEIENVRDGEHATCGVFQAPDMGELMWIV